MNQQQPTPETSTHHTRNRILLLSSVIILMLGILFGGFYWMRQTRIDTAVASDSHTTTIAPVLDEWYADAQENIIQSEYELSTTNNDTDLYQAPNRAHGFRTVFNETGIELQPRVSQTETWSWGLQLVAYGYDGQLDSVADGTQVVNGNRIEYQRGSLTEWYINSDDGLEQGFLLTTPPTPAADANTPLVLAMSLHGDQYPQLGENGEFIDFYNADGARIIHYGKLSVYDANQKQLPARLALNDCAGKPVPDSCQVQLHIEDQLALYPITIDPIATTPDWEGESNQWWALMGKSVNAAGDVNGDGYDDIILGAPDYDAGSGHEGKVFVFYGPLTELSVTADWTVEGAPDSTLGASANTAGDVNNDGYDDVIIGAPYWWEDSSNPAGGTTSVYLGSATGISTTAIWSVDAAQSAEKFGRSVSSAGDINGDGYDDIIVGASNHHTTGIEQGRAYVYLGSATGISTTAPWTYDHSDSNSSFAFSVNTAGDVNADGYDDVIIGSGWGDIVTAFYGSATGLNNTPDWTVTQAWVHTERLGNAVSGAGDVNGDGYDDVIVGSVTYSNGQTDEGRASIYYGSSAGLYPNPSWLYESNQANTEFGYSVATAGDVNGDGYDDVMVGAPFYEDGKKNEGAAFLFFGSESGVSNSPDWMVESNKKNSRLGYYVGSAGDVDNDGYDDMLVGAPYHENGQTNEGVVSLYYGSGDVLPPIPTPTPANVVCTTYTSNDVPKTIAERGTPLVNSTLLITDTGSIVDINVVNLVGEHTYIGSLDFTLQSPAGTSLPLMQSVCDEEDDFNVSFDDETAPLSLPCPPVGGGTYTPAEPLSIFDGETFTGTWTLTIKDYYDWDGGQLDGWGLEICTASSGATATPTNTPTALPTNTPTALPPNTPTALPTNTPTALPTNTPTSLPTNTPTSLPTATPITQPTPPPVSETVSISPVLQTVDVGSVFTITVDITDIVSPISAYQFDLAYDANLLRLEKVDKGGFLLTTGQDVVCPDWVEPTVGSMRLACVSVGPDAGAMGDGRFATLTFTAMAVGNSDLTLSAVQLADTSVPPAAVGATLVNSQVTISTGGSANAPIMVASTDNNGGNGSVWANVWQSAQVENAERLLLLFTLVGFLLIVSNYLRQRRQLDYIWRLLVVVSMLLQTLLILPPVTHAVANDRATETETTIRPNNELRSTANLAPPISPTMVTSQDCYDADLDCDKDVDETDVTQSFYSWDCGQGTVCYDIDADIDDNNIVDAFDLAWFTNDYDIAPPEISITAPAEGAVIAEANLTVSGLLTDTHNIVQVTINDVAATIVGNTFEAQLPVEADNFVLDVVAEDEVGLIGLASQVVTTDQDGPMVKIETPPDGLPVYTASPEVTVSYRDFLSSVNANSFSAEIQDSVGTTIQTFDSSVASSDLAQFTLAPLVLDQSYTLIVTIADEYGNTSVTSSSFYVTPDTNIVPPVVPVSPGWISGRIYNSSSCNQHLTTCQGVAGARVTLMQVDPNLLEEARTDRAHEYEVSGQLDGVFPTGNVAIIDTFATLVDGTLLTGPDGFYAFPVDATGVYHVRVEKDGFTYGQREVTAVRERSTAVNEIYLTPLDWPPTLCGDAGCSHTSTDGQMTVEIPVGAIPTGEQVAVTATEFDRVNFLPSGSLPPGTAETYAFNLGGSSDYEFQQPITVSLRNSLGFAPGVTIPLGYWNQHIQQWEHASQGIVDNTGEWIEMQVTHFSMWDVNFFAPPAPDIDLHLEDENEEDDECSDGEEGCFINLKSGTLREWVTFPPVSVVGGSAAPQLGYSTSRANTSVVIDVQLDLDLTGTIAGEGYLTWELYIEGQKTDTFTFAANTDSSGEVGRYRYLWDGRNALGEQLPPGIYEYAVRISVPYQATYCNPVVFGATFCREIPAGLTSPDGVTVTAAKDVWVYGDISLNSQFGSSFGAGWVLDGQQFLYEDEAGRVLVSKDDALTQYHFDLHNLLDGAQSYNSPQPPVIGPESVAFPVETPTGGTYVGGAVNANTTWTLAQSPYIVQSDDVTVASGAVLTIEPGVQVLLDRERNIFVDGELDAQGTATDPITFTAFYDESASTTENIEDFEIFTFTHAGQNYGNMQAVTVDQGGDIWLAGSAFGEYGGNVMAVQHLHRNLLDKDEVPFPFSFYGSQIRNIAVDGNGRKWFATDHGLLMLAADNITWTHYTQISSNLNGDDVRAVTVDANNTVWLAIYGAGIQSLSSDGSTWSTYDTANSNIPSNSTHDVDFDNSGYLWVGTESGLAQYDLITDSWIIHDLDAGWPNIVERLAIDQDDNVWITVPTTGIRMLSNSDSTWTSYTMADGLKSNNVRTIAIDNVGRKWVGYVDVGVSVLSFDNANWDDKTELGLTATVNDLAISPTSSDVWLAVNDGSAIRNYLNSFFYDGTIIGGQWGTVQINGSTNLSHVMLEMGGVNQQSTLKFMQNPSPLSIADITVRSSGGHGIEVVNSTATLNNVTLLSNDGDGLHLGSGSIVEITNSEIQQSAQSGIFVDDAANLTASTVTLAYNDAAIYTGGDLATINLTNAVIMGNNGVTRLPAGANISQLVWQDNRHNEIEWLGGTIDSDYVWLNTDGIERHIILNDITIDSSATLTLPAGIELRFGYDSGLHVNGTLIAVGNFSNPIYLGVADNVSMWEGLTLSGPAADIAYTVVQNAGIGITVNGTNLNMSYLTLADNGRGIQVNNNASVTVTQSNFMGNGAFAIENTSGSSYVVNAQNNHWGHPDGPAHVSNPAGQGNAVSDDVDFSSWRSPVLLDNSAVFIESRTATDNTQLSYDPVTDTYTRYYPDGRFIHFDTQGRHDYTQQPDGRILAYTYNPDGTTATMEVTAPGQTAPNAIWTFNYTEGKLDSITDPIGRIVDITIDDNNQLRQVDIPDMGSRQFYYNQDNLLTQQVDEAGSVTSYEYDSYGRIATHTDPVRAVYDQQTGQTTFESEVRQFITSDTSYDLINTSAVGDPDTPALAVPTSADLNEQVSYAIGGRTTQTNEWGHITEQTDALNRTTNLQRDEANRVTRIDLPNDDCIEADYDEMGNVLSATRLPAAQCALAPSNRDPEQAQTSARTYEPRFNQPKVVTNPAGEQIVYYYDYELGQGDAGRVVRIDYPAILDEYGVLTTPSVAYSYNNLGLVETETDVRGTITRYVHTQGTPDEAANGATPLFAPGVTPVPGRITQVIGDDGGFGYTTTYKDFDALGNPQTIIFPGGHQVTSTYDALGRLVTDTNVIGIVTLYEYNDRGNVLRKVADYTADGATGDNIVTTYAYDSDGRLIHERTAADGLVIESYSRYDISGRPVSQIDGLGNETRYIYDDAGQLIETIDAANHSIIYTYTTDGLPETVTDAEGHITRTIYDDFGRVYQTIQAEGELDLTTTYTYTVDNLVTASEAPDGTVACFAYDSLHRRTETIQDCGPSGLNLTTSYAYDIAGNTVFVTDARGIVTYTEYDALGRVTLTRQDDDGLNYETSTTYHPVTGNLDTTVSVDGTVTQYIYDTYNRLEQVCQDSTGVNLCTTYTFDRRGRQETVTDAEGIVQQTVYNRLGLSVQEIADVNGLASTISYEYNDLLNLIQVADSNGNATQYSYTPRQEMETELYADGTSVSYAYDPRGGLATMMLQDSSVITHTYDAANRQTRLDFSSGGFQSFDYDNASRMTSATQTMDGHTTVTGYGYDSVGGVVTTTQQLDGGTAWLTQYAYDYVAGERDITYPSGIVRTYATDSLNRLDTVTEGGGSIIADYNYDVINRFNTVAYPTNGLTNQQDYDSLGRITQVTVNNGTADIVDYGYGYDNVGNRTYMQRNHQPNQLADVYEYDSLYQLVNVWYGADATAPGAITSYASTQGYDLDDLGNRLTVTENNVTENYGPHDGTQLTNVMNQYESVEGAALGYDVRGNTLTDGDTVYTYDILNRQTGVDNGNGTTEYIYDPRGRRVAKTNGGITTHFIYDTQYRVIEERDNSEAVLANFTYGQGMDEPLTMERGGQTYYYHRDALGSVTEVSNSTGAIVERYEYDVYGEVTIFDGSDNVLTASVIGNPYLFTGRRYDVESDNYYYRARYYSHKLGRFLSQDPLGFDAGDYNLYRYVFNNPTNLTDPSGKVPIPLIIGGILIVTKVIDYGWTAWEMVQSWTILNDECSLDEEKLLAYLNITLAVVFEGGEFIDDILPVGVPLDDIGRRAVVKAAREGVEEAGIEGFERAIRNAAGDDIADEAFRRMGLDDLVGALCSFSEETLVATDGGNVPIGDVEIGDYVLAYDEATGEIDYYPVTAVWAHEDPVIVYLTIDGETIETTPEHPFYTANSEWDAAGELHAGNKIRKADGSYGLVENVAFVYKLQPMYNLTVATAHTYFVGDGQWLVHNNCPFKIQNRTWKSVPRDGAFCRSGCDAVAQKIQNTIGGEIAHIKPKYEDPFLGGYGSNNHYSDWDEHFVVVKGGRVYDAFTGGNGLPIDEFKELWRYKDAIDFDF